MHRDVLDEQFVVEVASSSMSESGDGGRLKSRRNLASKPESAEASLRSASSPSPWSSRNPGSVEDREPERYVWELPPDIKKWLEPSLTGETGSVPAVRAKPASDVDAARRYYLSFTHGLYEPNSDPPHSVAEIPEAGIYGAGESLPLRERRSIDSTPWARKESPSLRLPIQRKAAGSGAGYAGSLADKPGTGTPLPAPLRAKFEKTFATDLAGVVVHTNSPLPATIGALAYAQSSELHFAPGTYDPDSIAGQELIGHEVAHVVQQRQGRVSATAVQGNGAAINNDPSLEYEADVLGAKAARGETAGATSAGAGASAVAARTDGPIQRKEVETESAISGAQDWTDDDRESKTERWQAACLHNLNAVDSSQYVKVVERRDFYKWFFQYSAAKGFDTRWALAASLVADGAHQIADMDDSHGLANDTLSMAGVELQGAMREGNQVIFDNVLPKLKKLLDGRALKGKAALRWDMETLAEEQTLIQPMYARMSAQTRTQLEYIARMKRMAWVGAQISGGNFVPPGEFNNIGFVPGFDQPDMQNIQDRWKYGMGLGKQFSKQDTGYDPSDAMPAVPASYTDGSEFAKVDNRQHLHELDAYLNPNRISHPGGIESIVAGLTEPEKKVVLSDKSADGWRYSSQFAQLSWVTDAIVRQSLPSDPGSAAAVGSFLRRYQSERDAANRKIEQLQRVPGPKY